MKNQRWLAKAVLVMADGDDALRAANDGLAVTYVCWCLRVGDEGIICWSLSFFSSSPFHPYLGGLILELKRGQVIILSSLLSMVPSK